MFNGNALAINFVELLISPLSAKRHEPFDALLMGLAKQRNRCAYAVKICHLNGLGRR